MAEDAALFRLTPGRYPGVSTKVTMGILKASQKRMKRAALSEQLISRAPGKEFGLIGDDPNGSCRPSTETGNDIFSDRQLYWEELAIIGDGLDCAHHVIKPVHLIGDQFAQKIFPPDRWDRLIDWPGPVPSLLRI